MNIDWQQFYTAIMPIIPASLASDFTALGAFIVASCAVAARFWPRPAEGSRWLGLYNIINRLAMNSRHAANADDTNSTKP